MPLIMVWYVSYVPPQNSTEYKEPAGPSGSATRSSTGQPIDRTLTGSGYTYVWNTIYMVSIINN